MAAATAPSRPRLTAASETCLCHRLQFYTADNDLLVRNVADYLCEGYQRGEGLLVVATQEHNAAFERRMRLSVPRMAFDYAVDTRQILFIDAKNLLSRLMPGGQLDWELFECVVGGLLRDVHSRRAGLPSRAFGEMVGLLWTEGKFAAALELEDFWNRILANGGFQLFCAYPIDVFSEEFHSPEAEMVIQSHSHLLPSGDSEALHAAVTRAAGAKLRAAHGSLRSDLPEGEAKIFWLRENVPNDAGEILRRARSHYGSEKRFRALVENSSDAIALTDQRGRILYASAATARVLGYHPEELVGLTAASLVHPLDRTAMSRGMRALLDQPRLPMHFQIRIRRKTGGWCWIEATGSNLLDEPDIAAVIFNCRDISERKSAELSLIESEAALREANASLEQFAYAAAHDLREPVRNVGIYLELLERDHAGKLDADARRLIAVAREGAVRMQTLTRDLLAFTRSLDDPAPAAAGAGHIADTKQALSDVLANLRTSIEEGGAQVTWDRLPPLPMRQFHLVQLLQNLIDNALKYRTSEAPRIHVSVRGTGGPGPENEWVVRVADNGIGVPLEYRDQIFGMFRRLHGREIPGNGIGLAICSRLVAHYRGRIKVEPKPGGGSIFSFTIPRGNAHDRKSWGG